MAIIYVNKESASKSRVLGIDPSTKTGLVLLDGTEVQASVMTNPKVKGVARVSWLRKEFDRYLDRVPAIDCAVIEGYAYANRFTLATLIEVGINFRLSLHERAIPCYICPPSVLKKWSTGNGGAKKPEVATAVSGKWGYDSPSDDVVDAYVLAKMAYELSKGRKVHGIELLV